MKITIMDIQQKFLPEIELSYNDILETETCGSESNGIYVSGKTI